MNSATHTAELAHTAEGALGSEQVVVWDWKGKQLWLG
jgi:hypothetical protein